MCNFGRNAMRSKTSLVGIKTKIKCYITALTHASNFNMLDVVRLRAFCVVVLFFVYLAHVLLRTGVNDERTENQQTSTPAN